MSKNQELQVHVEVNGIDEATKKLKDMSKIERSQNGRIGFNAF